MLAARREALVRASAQKALLPWRPRSVFAWFRMLGVRSRSAIATATPAEEDTIADVTALQMTDSRAVFSVCCRSHGVACLALGPVDAASVH